MATYNGNNIYLEFNGIDLSAYWTGEISREQSNDTQEVTAGAGQTHVQRKSGLTDMNFGFNVMYDDVTKASYVQTLVPGTEGILVYGPEGNAAGKPRDQRVCIVESVTGPNPGIEKPAVMFEIKFVQADRPAYFIERGDTF